MALYFGPNVIKRSKVKVRVTTRPYTVKKMEMYALTASIQILSRSYLKEADSFISCIFNKSEF